MHQALNCIITRLRKKEEKNNTPPPNLPPPVQHPHTMSHGTHPLCYQHQEEEMPTRLLKNGPSKGLVVGDLPLPGIGQSGVAS